MLHFLVPCECGQKLEVTAAQAGQRLTCVCKRAVDVPTLRGLQSLERIGEDAAPVAPRWAARQGLLFLGAAITAASLIAAVWLQLDRPTQWVVVERLRPRSDPPGPLTLESTEPMAVLDGLTPAEVWLTWRSTTPAGIDRRISKLGMFADSNETHWVLAWRDWRYLAWMVGGVGVALVIISFLIPERSSRRPAIRNQAESAS